MHCHYNSRKKISVRIAVLTHASVVARKKSQPPTTLPSQSVHCTSSYLFRTVLGIRARHPNQMRMRGDKHVTSRTEQRTGNTCVTITWSSICLRVRCMYFHLHTSEGTGNFTKICASTYKHMCRILHGASLSFLG